MTTFTSRGVPLAEANDPADIAARVNPVAQLVHDRPGVSALTTTERNALTGAELWDGRIVLNTTTDRLNRYDLGATSWIEIADTQDLATLLATSGTPAAPGTASRGVSNFAARADHIHPLEFVLPSALAATATVSGTAAAAGVRLYAQGGTVEATANATGDLIITFPTAFPTGLVAAVFMPGDASLDCRTILPLSGTSVGNGGATVRCFTASGSAFVGAVRIDYLALGW